MRQKVMLLVLVFLLAYPVKALGVDFDWTLTWQADQTLTETITTDTPELISPRGGWQALNGQENTFTRSTPGWAAYNALPDRLPIEAGTKNYLVAKKTKITPNAETYQGGSTFYDLTRAGQGQVKIEAPGFIMKAKPAVKAQWSQGFTATWTTARQEDSQEYNFSMQAITLEIIPSIVAVLIIAWGLVWIIYRRQVKRMERLIEERYSLENVVRAEVPIMEQTETGEATAEGTKNP
ncbi:MAG: hypothetical protein ACOX0F_00395 [Syntrophomonadaceae bacterium]|jgi:hypothetical protein